MKGTKTMENEIISLDSIGIEEEIITHERYNRPTPNGGDYSEIFYMDDDGNYVDKKVATKAVIYECKNDGTAINRTFMEKRK